VPAYDSQPLSFCDTIKQVRMFDAANMNPAFVDIAGTNAIGSFEQYQQPPEAWMRPSVMLPSGRVATTYMGGLQAPNEDVENDTQFQLARDEGRDTFPYQVPALKNYQLRM
jgi:hypothetical protein